MGVAWQAAIGAGQGGRAERGTANPLAPVAQVQAAVLWCAERRASPLLHCSTGRWPAAAAVAAAAPPPHHEGKGLIGLGLDGLVDHILHRLLQVVLLDVGGGGLRALRERRRRLARWRGGRAPAAPQPASQPPPPAQSQVPPRLALWSAGARCRGLGAVRPPTGPGRLSGRGRERGAQGMEDPMGLGWAATLAAISALAGPRRPPQPGPGQRRGRGAGERSPCPWRRTPGEPKCAALASTRTCSGRGPVRSHQGPAAGRGSQPAIKGMATVPGGSHHGARSTGPGREAGGPV